MRRFRVVCSWASFVKSSLAGPGLSAKNESAYVVSSSNGEGCLLTLEPYPPVQSLRARCVLSVLALRGLVSRANSSSPASVLFCWKAAGQNWKARRRIFTTAITSGGHTTTRGCTDCVILAARPTTGLGNARCQIPSTLSTVRVSHTLVGHFQGIIWSLGTGVLKLFVSSVPLVTLLPIGELQTAKFLIRFAVHVSSAKFCRSARRRGLGLNTHRNCGKQRR